MTLLAVRLLDHAARIMPPSRRDWVRGMRAELAHIPAPAAAAAFALGCIWASYTQRIQDMMTLIRLSRWAFAAYALVCAGGYLLATALLGAVKASPQLTPGDLGTDPGTAEALRFVQGYPTWQLAGFVLVAGLLAAGAVLLVRRRPAALPMLASGVAAATVIAVLDSRLLGAADWPLAWSGAWLIPLLSLGPVWWLSRRAPDLKTA
jgi:hypothetical protein